MKNTGTKTYFKKIIENYFVSKVDTIVWNSRFLKKELQTIYKKHDIKILYPLVDDIFYQDFISDENNKWDKKVVTKTIFVAWRWDIWKWLSEVFQIYKNLKEKYNFHIHIAWIWIEQEKFEKLYKEDEKIKFLWKLKNDEMKYNFHTSDLFLFPSKIDSFGLVILESLLSNTPVISYNLWEAQFLIKNWENWYKVQDIDEYTDVVEKLLMDDNLLEKLKKQSKKSVVSNYSMKNFEKQLAEIIFEK